MGARGLRTLFVAVSAITAATLLDPMLESLSNAGFFGPGRFTDNSMADVAPALLVATVLAMLFVILSARRQWLRDNLAHLSLERTYPMLPSIFIVQLVTLFTMETAEQYFVYGHGLGGTLWLGAPVTIALTVHALGGALISLILARGLQCLAARVVGVVRRALGAFARRFLLSPRQARRSFEASLVRVVAPLLRRLAGRAPPRPSFA